jgi:hypothetical protein
VSMKWILVLTLSWLCDLYLVRGTRPGQAAGSDILWTDSVPIGLFTAIECD